MFVQQQDHPTSAPVRRSAVRRGLGPAAGLLALLLAAPPAPARDEPIAPPPPSPLVERVAAVLERVLGDEGENGIAAEALALHGGALKRFYADRGFQPTWIGAEGPNGRAMAALEALRLAGDEGLRPEDYRPAAADWMAAESLPERLAELELSLSRALIGFADDLRTGRLSPRDAGVELAAAPAEIDGAELLHGAAAATDVRGLFADLAPKNPYYRGLREALAAYRAIQARGGWPALGPGPDLQRGARGERVLALRQRLEATGDLAARGDDGDGERDDVFDRELEDAVRTFQRRHGLAVDGVVGRRTRAALDVPVEDRIRQIIVNMERWRWMPDDLGARYILVNLAGFELRVVEDGEPVLTMPVVVGRPYRSTPVFSEKLTYLVTNPYWHVPRTIAVEDIVPKARQDPAYLVEQGLRVFYGWGEDAIELNPLGLDWRRLGDRAFPFHLRQEPGPRNPLGRIKFMLPNKHDIYLHDTPDRHLFRQEVRAASSGCIRLADPIALAEYLLRDHPRLGQGGIRAAIESGRTLDFRLKEPVPVHLTYSTAWVDDGDGGAVHFRDDIYGRDEPLTQALVPTQAADAR